MTKLIAAFALCVSLGSCSFFNKDVKPVLTCAGKVVPLADITRVEQDLSPPPNYIDLAEVCATVGWDVGACIIDNAKANKPALKAAADEFKRQHAVEIRSAQPVSMRSPGDPTPKPGTTACEGSNCGKFVSGAVVASASPGSTAVVSERLGAAPGTTLDFSYAGQNPGTSLAACYRDCGDNAHGAIAPPGGCECWRKVGSTWRWVALRGSSPSGAGPGAVGGGGAIVASSR